MPEFTYKTKGRNGKTVTGKKISSSREDLIIELEKGGFTIISIEKAKEEKKPLPKVLAKKWASHKKVKTFELIILCKQLAVMLHGGIPILDAMESITGEMKTPRLRNVLEDVTQNVTEGKALFESLKKHPDVFSTLFVSIVEAGEKIGALDEMLRRLSDYLEAQERLIRKLRAATIYPACIVSFFLFSIGVVLPLFIVPRFRELYGDFGARLPVLTRIVFTLSDLLPLLVLLLVVTGFSFFFFIKHSGKGQASADRTILKLPVFGDVIKKAAVCKFCRTLSTLLAQGIPITEALLLVGKTSGNMIIEEASIKSSKLIVEGDTIPAAFIKVSIFPSLMLQMASTGVNSGSLPDLMDKTADFYEEQVDDFVGTLTVLLEPILVVSLGMFVAIVVLALYLPIFKLGSATTGGGG